MLYDVKLESATAVFPYLIVLNLQCDCSRKRSVTVFEILYKIVFFENCILYE